MKFIRKISANDVSLRRHYEELAKRNEVIMEEGLEMYPPCEVDIKRKEGDR